MPLRLQRSTLLPDLNRKYLFHVKQEMRSPDEPFSCP